MYFYFIGLHVCMCVCVFVVTSQHPAAGPSQTRIIGRFCQAWTWQSQRPTVSSHSVTLRRQRVPKDLIILQSRCMCRYPTWGGGLALLPRLRRSCMQQNITSPHLPCHDRLDSQELALQAACRSAGPRSTFSNNSTGPRPRPRL